MATVVTKLLNIVRPQRAYFGRKDAQQLLIIEQSCTRFDIGGDGDRLAETVRDKDGLAMSSRNQYLSAANRRQALALHKALEVCRIQIERGERDAMKVLEAMAEILEQHPDVEIDYVALVDAHAGRFENAAGRRLDSNRSESRNDTPDRQRPF